MSDYAERLITDLPDQFKGKERIEALMRVIGKQFDDLAQFYSDLNTKRSLSTAEGLQLDRIGSILGLNRAEAGALISDEDTVLDDETYRYILGYKIMLNMGQSTYYDIVQGIRQFYNVYPIKYYESPDEPAAFTLEISADDDTRSIILRNILPVKAAGVLTYYQFSLDAPTIEVSEQLEKYAYTGLECGIPLCGTYWMTATLGSSGSHEVNSGQDVSGYPYNPDLTGTVPDTATLGSSGNGADLEAGGSVAGYTQDANVSGEVTTGEYPGTATLGSSGNSADLEANIEVDSYSSGISAAGQSSSGELPVTATTGSTATSLDVELVSDEVEMAAAQASESGMLFCGAVKI